MTDVSKLALMVQKALGEVAQYKATLDANMERTRELEAESSLKDRKLKEMDEKVKNFIFVEDGMKIKIRELEEKIKGMDTARAAAKQALEEASENIQKSSNETRNLLSLNHGLKSELEKMKIEKSELETELDKFRKENDILKKRIKDKSSRDEKITDLRRQISELQKEKIQFSKNTVSEKNALISYDVENKQLREENHRLLDQLKAFKNYDKKRKAIFEDLQHETLRLHKKICSISCQEFNEREMQFLEKPPSNNTSEQQSGHSSQSEIDDMMPLKRRAMRNKLKERRTGHCRKAKRISINDSDIESLEICPISDDSALLESLSDFERALSIDNPLSDVSPSPSLITAHSSELIRIVIEFSQSLPAKMGRRRSFNPENIIGLVESFRIPAVIKKIQEITSLLISTNLAQMTIVELVKIFDYNLDELTSPSVVLLSLLLANLCLRVSDSQDSFFFLCHEILLISIESKDFEKREFFFIILAVTLKFTSIWDLYTSKYHKYLVCSFSHLLNQLRRDDQVAKFAVDSLITHLDNETILHISDQQQLVSEIINSLMSEVLSPERGKQVVFALELILTFICRQENSTDSILQAKGALLFKSANKSRYFRITAIHGLHSLYRVLENRSSATGDNAGKSEIIESLVLRAMKDLHEFGEDYIAALPNYIQELIYANI